MSTALPNRSPRMRRWAQLALVGVVLLLASAAWARGGGGGSYSGGSDSFSGGSGGGGGLADGLFSALIDLCFEEPQIGLPILAIVILFLVARASLANERHQSGDWNSVAAAPAVPEVPPTEPARSALERLRQVDEDFSLVLFEDFLYGLYAEAHHAAGAGQLERLSAYLSPGARSTLASAVQGEVRHVIIGAMHLVAVEGMRDEQVSEVRVTVEFEANFAVAGSNGLEQAYYVRDQWRLVRLKAARSRPPARTRVFTCPNCGAPVDAVMGGQCSYCKKNVATGEFDWLVQQVVEEDRQTRGPMLTDTTRETGMSALTVVDPAARGALDALRRRDPAFDWATFQARLRLIFVEFQSAWSERDLVRMRPYLSDKLFDEQRYWVETYRKQHLRNVVAYPHLGRTQLAQVTSDKYFDAITVRIFGAAHDYTVDDEGRRVSGNPQIETVFSEYWTLIRAAGAKGAAKAEKRCPHCGAPLKINMAGVCEYCQVTVTSGEFDWVLSRIEQTVSYRG